jgi:hypothetical protein
MQESRVELVGENEDLKRRVSDLSADRDALRTGAEQERAHLRSSNDRIAEYLGTAAQRPPGTATATASATNDATSTYENGTTLSTGSGSGSGANGPPAAPAQIQAVQPTPAKPLPPGGIPDAAPEPAAPVRRSAVLRRAAAPGCDVAAKPAQPGAPAADPGATKPVQVAAPAANPDGP